jgi:signal transduction histidine kinase
MLVFLVFTVVIGILFFVQFRNYTIDLHKSDLKAQATLLASSLSGEKTHNLGKGSERYGAYMKFIGELSDTEVWIVDRDMNLLTVTKGQGTYNAKYNITDLPTDAESLISEVFEGKTVFSEDFSGVLSELTLTVGSPIAYEDNEIWGAVLLHAPVQGMNTILDQGLLIISISILFALLIAMFLSVLLSDLFTSPLTKMKNTAISLSEGDYDVQSDIHQRDEIGELSDVINQLAERLVVAKKQSSSLESMRREFLANVTHELKTPVTVIRGSLEALCDEVVTEPEKVKDYYCQMLVETKFLQRLLEDLLDLAKLQNTDFPIEMEDVNLCDVINDAVKSASQIALEKDIKISISLPEPCVSILGDYGRLRQMLMIVLDNAVKFSPRSSIIEVHAGKEIISIRDFGPGFEEESLPFLFDRFYKERNENNKSGTGLGLSIAKQIAERHHIKVTASNHAEKGAIISFMLPDNNLNF